MNLGEPDYLFDDDEVNALVGRMWSRAKPGILLVSTWDQVICKGASHYEVVTPLTRLTKRSDREALARDREFFEWLKPRLERHQGFTALQSHFAALGVKGGYRAFSEYVGEARTYVFRVGKEALPALEEMAQEEAWLRTPEERSKGAEDFRNYMLRNFDKDWEENRKRLPKVDRSPYELHPLEERWQQSL